MMCTSSQITAHSSPTHSRHQSSSSLINYHTLSTGMMGSTIQLPTSSTSSNLPSSSVNQISSLPNSGNSINNLSESHIPQIHSGLNYPEEFYANPNEFGDLGQSEHYIYVTYPPELKRRLLERYGKDLYLILLKKDECE